MVLFLLGLGLGIRAYLAQQRIKDDHGGRIALEYSRIRETWCRGTDLALMGWGSIALVKGVKLDGWVSFILCGYGVLGLGACATFVARRSNLYDREVGGKPWGNLPWAAADDPMRRAWKLYFATESAIGIAIWSAQYVLPALSGA